MNEILPIVATVIGIIAQTGYYLQAYKIFKNKSTENISITIFILYSMLLLLWIVYGVMISNSPIIICNVLGIIGCISTIILYIYFKKERVEKV